MYAKVESSAPVLIPVTTANFGSAPARSCHPASNPAPNAPRSPPPDIINKLCGGPPTAPRRCSASR